jgi:hypothetical protein
MHRLRKLFAAALAALCLSSPAAHAAFLTDLWWSPDESGWGANIVHQDDVAFVTLFVYGADGAPTWFVATASLVALLPNGLPVMEGTLYRTRGPRFGGAFDPSKVQAAPVGRLSISPLDRAHARFDYDVDGAYVSRTVARQTLRVPIAEPASLGYAATLSLTLRAPDTLPVKSRAAGTAQLQISSAMLDLVLRVDGETCHHHGPILQEGRLGSMAGVYVCNSGRSGTVEISELELSRNGFVARIAMSVPDGVLAGTIAGAAR